MTERVTRPADAAKCNWGTGGGAYPKGDPGSGKRDVGYKPKDYPTAGAGDVIPAEDHNFLWNLGMDMLSWLRDFAPREWSDVYEGIANTVTSQFFRIYAPTAGIRDRASQYWTQNSTASTGGNVFFLCTDGEQIYYAGGAPAQAIIAASPVDGSEIWENDPDSQTISSLAVDGGFVYYTTGNVAALGLRRLNRSTGAYDTAGGTEYGGGPLATNGEYAVLIDGTVSGNGYVTFWSGIQGTITQDGTANTTSANLRDITIDATQCYTVGQRNTDDLWCYNLSSRALQFATPMPTAADPVANTVCSDGDFVYVGTNRAALTAGGNASLFVYSRVGDFIYSHDFGAGVNVDFLNVDDEYLYVTTNANQTSIIPKSIMPYGRVGTITFSIGKPACDGLSIVVRNSGAANNFRRWWTHGGAKTFMRANPADPNRRPFFNLAIPTGGRM